MLRGLLLVFTLITGLFFQMHAHGSLNSQKIVVVGGGLAGLTISYRLQEMGHDVELYEARKRVGGRVFTINVNGTLVELGGQNIQDGGQAENMLSLISELGLETEGKKMLLHIFFADEKQIVDPFPLLHDLGFTPEKIPEKLEEASKSANNMSEVLKTLFVDQDILYKIFYVRLAAYEGIAPEFLSLATLPTLYHMLLGGLSVVHQSNEEEKVYVNSSWVKGGNSVLAYKLAEKLGNRIHTEEPLLAIRKNVDNKYQLRFKSGKEVTSDLVVLAIPCTVFEDISIDEQVIPPEKLSAIRSIKYGTNSKIFVPVSQPYPEGSFTNGRLLSYFPGQFQVMNFFYIGKYGQFNADTIEETFYKDFAVMEKIYPFIQNLKAPVLALEEAFTFYDRPVGHSWPNDPYAKGSYSCLAIGQEKQLTECECVHGEKVKKLFAPIDNHLFFIGEHTSILPDVGGTMEAAVESGERMARIIDKTLQNSN